MGDLMIAIPHFMFAIVNYMKAISHLIPAKSLLKSAMDK